MISIKDGHITPLDAYPSKKNTIVELRKFCRQDIEKRSEFREFISNEGLQAGLASGVAQRRGPSEPSWNNSGK